MTENGEAGPRIGTAAAEHLSPAFPERAAWGTVSKLRAWQAEAMDAYFASEPRDFLAAATPGAGKTTFALRLAAELLSRRTVDRVTVVAPTEHLKKQWAEAASRAGIRLDPEFSNRAGVVGRHFHGVVVTYAQVATRAALHESLTASSRTLVILDEVHHGGDALSWGDAIREAFSPAVRRLSLTGTPFRSDTAPIPFVTYLPDREGIRTSVTDFDYGYGRALADGVVRPVIFMVYAGHMRWRTSTGDEMEARLGEGNTKDITSQAWRTALDPAGEWIPSVLRAADRRLTEVRHGVPDAGGLVIATDHFAAKGYAAILERLTGEAPTVVLSDDAEASAKIDSFSEGTGRWLVAVRMVSEGVDVPRLSVGVYATSASTPLFFAQAIGRFVRARRRGETASVFLPNVPQLMNLAAELERVRDHALDRRQDPNAEGDLWNPEDAMMGEANRSDKASDSLMGEFSFEAIASDATFDRVVFDGDEFGSYAVPGTEEELDFIGIPGILEPDQVHELLTQRHQRQARRIDGKRKQAPPEEQPPQALYRTLKEQRSLLNSLVGLYAKNTNEPHGLVHAELRRVCGGPPVAQASVTQLQQRIDYLRRRLGSH
ncbi:superfamily II DNA or RNA helicase [Labedella gwakjiensis]|uniref:DEAD/DEAH box helicase n=1 Tax=Labedella gwakjiensis TaxID=390269 RepID=A0A2P8H017_9MICO|nr:DEAD/DEAH box helicase [Labedella gwakjiensis]PSL39556.1 superfamily II DNA or RNA helicase [Labedella gwakjiensis]RUQ86047.1 DEAD/DEAH box helicase [Labedella gwakjiensis]